MDNMKENSAPSPCSKRKSEPALRVDNGQRVKRHLEVGACSAFPTRPLAQRNEILRGDGATSLGKEKDAAASDLEEPDFSAFVTPKSMEGQPATAAVTSASNSVVAAAAPAAPASAFKIEISNAKKEQTAANSLVSSGSTSPGKKPSVDWKQICQDLGKELGQFNREDVLRRAGQKYGIDPKRLRFSRGGKKYLQDLPEKLGYTTVVESNRGKSNDTDAPTTSATAAAAAATAGNDAISLREYLGHLDNMAGCPMLTSEVVGVLQPLTQALLAAEPGLVGVFERHNWRDTEFVGSVDPAKLRDDLRSPPSKTSTPSVTRKVATSTRQEVRRYRSRYLDFRAEAPATLPDDVKHERLPGLSSNPLEECLALATYLLAQDPSGLQYPLSADSLMKILRHHDKQQLALHDCLQMHQPQRQQQQQQQRQHQQHQ
eukprot:m.259792 g.259792  ORF g.259792 m.259792 type:complete len:430 (+) comp22735_c10_seq1:223-1512(+)